MGVTIRILLADSSPIELLGLRELFHQFSDLSVVAEASDWREALRLAGAMEPDVAIIDSKLSRWDNSLVTLSDSRSRPGFKILAFCALEESASIHKMIELGATGYILKNESPELIVHAVRAVGRGGGWLTPAIAGTLSRMLQKSANEPPRLTKREQDVLRALAKGTSNTDIAAELGIAERTIRFHIGNIYAKLGLQSRTQVALWALRNSPFNESA